MINIQKLTYTYPHSFKPAIDNLSLRVAPGEIVCVTGESGCGKSTLIRLLNGLCPQVHAGRLEGCVFVNGTSNLERAVADIAADVGTLFQDPEAQFFALGVEDELAFVLEWQGLSRDEMRARVKAQAERYGITPVLNASIHALSEGEKQKVGLAAVTMGSPDGLKALILDEPTANLDPEATVALGKSLSLLADQGLAIIVVDHRLYWLKDVAHRLVVLSDGRIVREGAFLDVSEDELARWGCRSPMPIVADSHPDALAADPKAGALGFEDLHFAHPGRAPIFAGLTGSLKPGITALLGPNGVGKTTLARLLTGLTKAQKGRFFLHGAPIPQKDLLKHVAIVLQNADHQLQMSSVLDEVKTALVLAGEADPDGAAMMLLAEFDLTPFSHRHPQSLSGGQKQRLVIACALAKNPALLILDEPTSGLDGRNMARISKALQKRARAGTTILVITHDLELLSVCTSALRLPFLTH